MRVAGSLKSVLKSSEVGLWDIEGCAEASQQRSGGKDLPEVDPKRRGQPKLDGTYYKDANP